MDKILSDMLSGVLVSLLSIYMWHRLHLEKMNFKDPKLYICIIIISIICTLNYYHVNSYLRIFTLILTFICANYIIFDKAGHLNIIVPIVSEIIILISELIISIVAFGILKLDVNVATSQYFGSLLINAIVCVLSYVIVNIEIFRKLTLFLDKITSNISNKFLLIFFGLIVIVGNFFVALQYYEIKTEYIVIFNSIVMVVYSFIIIKMLEQKNKYIKINNKYNMTNNTLKELEQNVTRLKITNHENKNQLLTIRNMIKKGEDSDELIKHIEKIVDTKIKDDEQLMFQTSTITNSMISSIIYSKMLTMKENNINVSLSVDRDIKDLYLSDMSEELSVEVCKIIGVYLDNAIEAVSKLKDKIINIEVYAENKILCIAISNNYEGEINLVELDNPGYTTKSNGHGYGLSLVAEIVNDNHKLTTDREIKDNIFKQILKIKM